MRKRTTYADAGVDYKALDGFKRMALRTSEWTKFNVERLELQEVSSSRGEPTFLVDIGDAYLAHTIEVLGTKSIIADEMYQLHDQPAYYLTIGVDIVAAVMNDVATSGASSISFALFLGTGNSKWFDDMRGRQFLEGVKLGCKYASATWGQGETAVLPNIIQTDRLVTCGSGVGIIKPKKRWIRGNIEHGDAIVILESSGLHANGFSLVREHIKKQGRINYTTKLPDHRTLGDHLLEPSIVYCPVIEECLNQGINIHYASHITGHGWTKLMRADKPFHYVIEALPPAPLIFEYLQTVSQLSDKEMYATFNMGAGFALYVPEDHVDTVIKIANDCRYRIINAYHAGHIEQLRGKKVTVKPLGITFTAKDLQIR